MYKILIMNMGSTSTKVGLYEDELLFAEGTFRNSDEQMAEYPTQAEQIDLRKGQVMGWMQENDISMDSIDAAVIRVRGGDKCTKSGTYRIGDVLRKDIMAFYNPKDDKFPHAACMTLPLMDLLLEGRDIPLFIVDSVYTDEFTEVARISGHPLVPRESSFHALNQKAVAREAAAKLGKKYNQVKLVVAHLGGGVSIGAHDCGRVVDSSNCTQGCTGPFSANRAGGVPAWTLAKLCYSGEYTQAQMAELLFARGGFAAYTGLTDVRLIEKKATEGDATCELTLQAFAYQVAKEIAAQCSVLNVSQVDAIVLTGGMAYSERIVADVKKRIGSIAPVMVFPGEEEGPAMVAGALRVLRGEEEAMLL